MLVASLVLGLMPGTSGAATLYTAQAQGRGVQVSLAGNVLGDSQTAPRVADTDRVPAPNGDGTADCVAATDANQCRTGPKAESIVGIPLLSNVLSAGVAAQDAFVTDTGTSGACAGLVGPGGLISIDATPQGCVVANPSNPGGVYINLIDGIPLTLYRLRLDAAYAQCTASAGNPEANPPVPPSASGSSSVANAVLEQVITVPFVGQTVVPVAVIPVTSAPNSQVFPPPPPSPFSPISDLVRIRSNTQTLSPDGSRIDVTALHITVLAPAPGGGLLDIKLGQVSCGRNTAVIAATTTSTSTSSTSSSTSTTAPGSTTTSTAPGSTTTSTAPASTTTSTAPASTTTSTAPASTTSTTAPASTTSTTAAATTSSSSTSSTVASSTTSTTAPAATTTTRKPLAKTGANTRAQLSLALGLVGLGFVVTGRGMQLGFAGPQRRNRR